ncbi:hypothetical protein BDK51DRAFT_39107 [Blyttiomyces helicus]|uniref:Uncharacterized protein n=1 Tax=Blyttiomyces helicus TaxID=388810 RepID=A0A4P9WQV3_9FUNG|nr:hypothetical protein BDK51DRAFT_39107 [Blyttiomyces helicus]|eukprot:RKO94785.1 hypothetical protein BDK51DRAFT_39107 [Blyttiomyces helicus]
MDSNFDRRKLALLAAFPKLLLDQLEVIWLAALVAAGSAGDDMMMEKTLVWAWSEALHLILGPHKTGETTRLRKPVPSQECILLFLYYMTEGGPILQTSQQFGKGLITVADLVRIVAAAKVKHMFLVYVKWPWAAKLMRTATYFERNLHNPQCTGRWTDSIAQS